MKRRGRGILLAALVLAAAATAAAAFILASRPTVAERWSLYVENLEPARKIVVLTSFQRYTASKEFTARLLALLDIKASIELSAWADVAYFVDAADAAQWSLDWDRKTRRLELTAPEPDCLPPAVRTDTIEIKTIGGNLVSNAVFRLKQEAAAMRDALSSDLAVRARASLADPEVRDGIREGLAGFASSFCLAAFGFPPSEVLVRLRGD